MRIAIVGARLAGSYAAWLLASRGHEVLLLDPAPDEEKPCGGGVTAKALRRMSWLREAGLPHTEIRRLRMIAGDGRAGELELRRPIHIFARRTLDDFLRARAESAGARFVVARAIGFEKVSRGWRVRTSGGGHEVDFLIGADGAASTVRRALCGPYRTSDLSLALGFYVPGIHHQDTVVVHFQEAGFEGYLWTFPRVDHTSVGILRLLERASAADLRARVSEFIRRSYPDAGPPRFYAARIPCLARETLSTQRVVGDAWALLGDAAGFADAITAEGIYFALRSAELVADALVRGAPRAYEAAWRADFGRDLAKAAAWRDRFYAGTFLSGGFTQRAVSMTARSRTVRRLTDRLVAGEIDYEAFRRRLIAAGPRVLAEAVADKWRERRHQLTRSSR